MPSNKTPPLSRDAIARATAEYLARGGQIAVCPAGVGGYTQAERNALFSGRKTAEQIAAERAEKLFGKKA